MLTEQDFESLRESHAEVAAKLLESETALEEVGEQLSRVTLENQRLKEERGGADFGAWQEDSAVTECQNCGKQFGLSRRKVRHKFQIRGHI